MDACDDTPLYQLISVTGPDAESFLQGQLTQDVRKVAASRALPAAACTPKGRVLATMMLARRADGFDLVIPADSAASLLQRLSLYKLRAKLDLTLRDELQSLAVDDDADGTELERAGLRPDDGTGSMTRKDSLLAIRIGGDTVMLFGPADAIDSLHLSAVRDREGWQAALVRAGIARIGTESAEKYTPHMLSLDLAGAISFNKGCYTGQEVVARTEHLGQSRRRLARYQCDTGGLAAGDELTLDDRAVGAIVAAAGGEILAVVPADLHGMSLKVDGRAATPVALPWQAGGTVAVT